jgi:lysophospholipase L1-like esterase
MKSLFSLLAFAITLVLFTACKKDDETNTKPQSTSINKILPLGASRVEGARPEHESFRYELWKDLVNSGVTFDFIGTQSDIASYPPFKESDFDADHEGRGGWTSGQILNGLGSWLEVTGSPDIVLFSSPGGNDALQGLPYENAVQNINSIIDVLQTNNPNVTIIIERMAPGRSDVMTSELTSYFNQIQQEVLSITTNQNTSRSQVIAVDMFTGFNDSLLADDVHYNEAGAEFIAARYYQVIQDVLDEVE